MEERRSMGEESRFELIRQTVEETHTVAMMRGMLGCSSFLENFARIRKLTRRNDLLPLVTDIYCDPKKLTAFIESLEPAAQELVRHLLWVEDESLDELIRRFDLCPPPGSWERQKYLPHSFLFKLDYNEQVRLQPGFDFLFRALLPRPEVKEKTWKGTAPGSFRYDPDGSLAGHLKEAFLLLLDAGFFKRKYNASVLAGTVKKLSKELSIPGFDWDEAYPGLRWRYFLPFLAFSLWDEEDEIPHEPPLDADPVDLLRQMVHGYFMSERYDLDLSLLLPHISIRRRELFFQDNGQQRPEYLPRILSFLNTWRWEDWLSLESLKDLLWTDNLRTPFPVNEDVTYRRHPEFGGRYTYWDTIRSRSEYRKAVFEPYVEGLIFLLGALGLFRLSWDQVPERENDDKSPVRPRLKALKMTSLGRAVFGLAPGSEGEFHLETSASTDLKGAVELDERYLIARVDPSQKAAVRFFSEISDALGSRLFKIDCDMLRKRCKTYQDLEEKFISLERYAGGELPPVWEKLRQDVMGSFVRLKAETDWVLYHLPETNKALLEWLRYSGATCFTPLPGSRVLVRKQEIPRFRKLLQKGGFNPLISD